jgi:hypothetical protein
MLDISLVLLPMVLTSLRTIIRAGGTALLAAYFGYITFRAVMFG